MTGDQRRDRIRTEAMARLATLGEMAAETVRLANEAAGERILTRRHPGIEDARRPDLDRMTAQCRAWLDAMQIVDRWLLPHGDARPLGAVLKVLPADELAEVTALLTRAGVLTPGDGG